MSESWRAIAIALGNAMANHRYCDDHASAEPGCPFCADRAVYQRYRAFAEHNGLRFRDPLAGVESVSMQIHEVRRRARLEEIRAELEEERQLYNCAVTNGLMGKARSITRRIDSLQHEMSKLW